MNSCYLEKAWCFGQHVPFDEDERTFGQCNIKDGDTLHFFLKRGKNLTLSIRNDTTPYSGRNTSYREEDSITIISDLKAMIHYSDPDTHKLQLELLTLQYNGLVLEDNKTLAEYKIQDGAELYFNFMQQLIFFSIPMYGQMEQILFEPMETIQHIKEKIMNMRHIFWYPRSATIVKPIVLQGVVRNNVSDTRSRVFLYLFHTPMTLYVINEGTPPPRDACSYPLVEKNTWEDICWLINYSAYYTHELKGQMIPIPKLIQTFTTSWMRAFTYEVEANELSTRKAMRLYFFPLTLKIFWLGHVHQSSTIGQALVVACEQSGKIPTKMVYNYDVCLTRKRSYLSKDLSFLYYRGLFEEKSEHITVLPRNDVEESGSINICVRWPSREYWVWLYFDPDDTIRELKIAIENILYVPFYIQRLSYLGRPLEDNNCTLGEVGIVSNSHVNMLTCPRAALTSFPIW